MRGLGGHGQDFGLSYKMGNQVYVIEYHFKSSVMALQEIKRGVGVIPAPMDYNPVMWIQKKNTQKNYILSAFV